MIIYPALDLRAGKVVRLKGGDPNQQTVYSTDPLITAKQWLAEGATWLHVVNLDGAFAESAGPNEAIAESLAALGTPVQLGGGLRSKAAIERAFAIGVSRVVLGTFAVENPAIVADLLAQYGPDKIAVALDARDGMVAIRGWQAVTNHAATDLGRQFAALGLRHALYTDVSRDGALGGVNLEATVSLAETTGLAVIASGGVVALDDVLKLRQSKAVAGVVIGTALYEKRFSLAAALEAAKP
jgi:phosphoribosylformimino-5-aminoimidazole carboxamide ribotide isomerase